MEISEHDDYMQPMESEQKSPGDEGPIQHLKLNISDSFLRSIRLMLAWYSNDPTQIKYSDRSKCEDLKTAQNIGNISKQVPTELPLLTLSVGSKKLIRTDECDIFARFYYLAKKVVCQWRNGVLSRRVEIPFSHITSFHVCFDHRGFDTLIIEAKLSFKSLSSVNTCPGKYPVWKVEDPQDAHRFPESKFVFLETEKGMLEKGFAKLMYTYPRLQRFVNFSRVTYTDQLRHHGRVNTQMQQTNMPTLHSLSSNIIFPYI